MQCVRIGSESLCCQGTAYINGDGKLEEEIDREAVIEVECPIHSFTVLNENSEVVKCDGTNCGRVCSSL